MNKYASILEQVGRWRTDAHDSLSRIKHHDSDRANMRLGHGLIDNFGTRLLALVMITVPPVLVLFIHALLPCFRCLGLLARLSLLPSVTFGTVVARDLVVLMTFGTLDHVALANTGRGHDLSTMTDQHLSVRVCDFLLLLTSDGCGRVVPSLHAP